MTRYHGDPATGPLFWLCLPIVLVYAAGKVALAWLKTKLPHALAPVRHCQECGWVLPEAELSLLCGVCRRGECSCCRVAEISAAEWYNREPCGPGCTTRRVK